MMQSDAELRDEVRDHMVQHQAGVGTAAVTMCMKSVYNDSGYDMCNYEQHVADVVATSASQSDIDQDLGSLGLQQHVPTMPTTQAMVVPKFAAAVVLCLRAKYGNLSAIEANRLLIEREYLRVCREACVRNVDIVGHQQVILNAFFTEGVMEELGTTRVRAPRWLREAFGSVPRVEPTIC